MFRGKRAYPVDTKDTTGIAWWISNSTTWGQVSQHECALDPRETLDFSLHLQDSPPGFGVQDSDLRCTAPAKPQACPAASQNRRLNQSSTDTLIDTVIGGRLPGVLTLEMQVPQLRLLPEHNRVSAEMVANAVGPALQSSHTGVFEISFALRYEASDRSIRAHHLPAFQRHLAGALGQLVGLARIVGVLADRNGELAHAECSGLQGAGLVFSARGKIMVTLCNLGAGGRDLLRALAHLGHYLV